MPTLRELSGAGAALLLVSHCGRPKGEPKPEYSLRPVADAILPFVDREFDEALEIPRQMSLL